MFYLAAYPSRRGCLVSRGGQLLYPRSRADRWLESDVNDYRAGWVSACGRTHGRSLVRRRGRERTYYHSWGGRRWR